MPRRRGFKVPDQLTGHETTCFKMIIPDDETYRRAFFGHLYELGNWLTWERGVSPGDTRATEAAQYWQQFLPTAEVGCDTDDCPSIEESNCISHPTASPIITYYPNNPFYPGDVPSGYDTNPLYLGQYSALPGTLDIDVICDIFTSLPNTLFDLPNLILNSGFPRFVVNFEGTGSVELHLVQVPLGGIAIITTDSDPTQIDIVGMGTYDVDLGVDDLLELIADDIAEANLVNEYIYEKRFDTEGPHHIDVTFIPNIEIVPLGLPIPLISWGGGLRRVVLCGVEPVFNPPQLQVTEDCRLEWSTDGGLTFVPVPGSENLANCFGSGGVGGDVAINLQVGAVDFFLRNSCPAGYLDFDDTERSKADYEELWAVLPDAFKNEVDETFTLPSIVGRSLVASGTDYDIGSFGGAIEQRILPRNLPRVSSTYTRYETLRRTQSGNDFSAWSGSTSVPTSPIGADVPLNIESPYFALKTCILAKPQEAAIASGIDGIKGKDGASPEMRVIGDEIQWRQDDGNPDWTLLYRISELRGPAGADANCDDCVDKFNEPPQLPAPDPADYPPDSDLDCIAAESILSKLRRETDIIVGAGKGASLFLIADLVLSLLATFFLPNPVSALLAIQALALLIATFLDLELPSLLTNNEWNEFKCILYCAMDGNGQLTESGYDSVRAQVDQKLEPGWQILYELMGLIGLTALNNSIGLEGITDGDCSICNCETPCAPVAIIWKDAPREPSDYPTGWSQGTQTIYPNDDIAQYRDSTGVWRNNDNWSDISLQYDFPQCYVTDVQMHFSRSPNSTVAAIYGIRPNGEIFTITSRNIAVGTGLLNDKVTGQANEILIGVVFVINGGETKITECRISDTEDT